MEQRAQLTVVIPAYNAAATLDGCLGALYASRGVEFEVIVVDDGSTDATHEVAARYPCRVISLPQNVGAAHAKNVGAQEATSEIIFFTDADVLVRPETLSYVVEDLRDPEVAGVVGLLAETCPYTDFASQFKNLWMHYTYSRQPKRVGLFFTSAAAIRREVFMREGGFDSHYSGASITEDIEFGQRLRSRGHQIIMDWRITVEHNKCYTPGEVLRTDLLRARGLVLTWLRNRLDRSGRSHYASVPWYFGAGVLMMGICALAVVLAIILGSGPLWLGAGVALLAAVALNISFLAALWRWRGASFFLQSVAFLWLDLFASGLGIALGLADFAWGRRY